MRRRARWRLSPGLRILELLHDALRFDTPSDRWYEQSMAMEKVTVALSPSVLKRAKSAVRKGRAKSLSALVNAVLDEQLRRDELNLLFDRWDEERGAPTATDEAWARHVLGL